MIESCCKTLQKVLFKISEDPLKQKLRKYLKSFKENPSASFRRILFAIVRYSEINIKSVNIYKYIERERGISKYGR